MSEKRRIFEWDDAKNAANVRKHGLSFGDASRIWEGEVLTRFDRRDDRGEVREQSLGFLTTLVIAAVAHTDRDGRVRIISARKATREEQKEYERHLRRTYG